MAEDARGPQGDLDVRPWWNAESLALRSEVIKLSEDSLFVLCMCHGGWLHMNCNQEINLERQKIIERDMAGVAVTRYWDERC